MRQENNGTCHCRVSEPEPRFLAGAVAVTLARLRLHLKHLLNNSRKLYKKLTSFYVVSKVNIN